MSDETPPPPLTADEILDLHRVVLNSIIHRRLDQVALRQLPSMDAALIARVAWKAGVMTRADLDKLAHEATFNATLKPYLPPGVRRRRDANRRSTAR